MASPIEHVSGVLEVIQIDVGVAVIRGNREPEPHPGPAAGCVKARIGAVHKFIPEHQAEMPRVLQGESDEGATQCAHLEHDVLREPDLFEAAVESFKGQEGDLGDEPLGAAEVVRRRSRGDARPLGGCTQRKGLDAPLGDELVSGADEGGPKMPATQICAPFSTPTSSAPCTSSRPHCPICVNSAAGTSSPSPAPSASAPCR